MRIGALVRHALRTLIKRGTAAALEILGVSPADVWYVGDTPGFDIVGARRAGLRPILMDPFGLSGDFGVTCVTSLSELAGKIL